MKILRNQFFNTLRNSLKTIVLSLIVSLGLFNINAQVQLKIEPGVLLNTESENLGLMLNVEPFIEISSNKVIGLRFGLALNPQRFETNDSSQFFFDDVNDNAILSFMPTFDHYFNENYTRPYLGMGFGYYVFSSVDIANPSGGITEARIDNQLGFLLRGGVHWGKTKFGLEYNFIPKADIKIANDLIIGTAANSYYGVSIGFMIGGTKSTLQAQ